MMDRDELDMIRDMLERMLREASLEEIETDRSGKKARALWRIFEENGFTRFCVSEDHGGLGAGLAEALPLITVAGRFALPLPLGETMIAAALLSEVGIEPPNGPLGIVDQSSGRPILSHADLCGNAVILADGNLSLIEVTPDAVTIESKSEDGAGLVDLTRCETLEEASAPPWCTGDVWIALGALIRAAAMAGAMQAVLDITLEYTMDREQFGRPLAKFQAIQHHLSDLACETAACAAAVDLAADALAADPRAGAQVLDDIAVAKVRCGSAATQSAARAHQAHGAIGFTREYALGRFSRRLWQWQDDFGSETYWAIRLGQAALGTPESGLWSRISV